MTFGVLTASIVYASVLDVMVSSTAPTDLTNSTAVSFKLVSLISWKLMFYCFFVSTSL